MESQLPLHNVAVKMAFSNCDWKWFAYRMRQIYLGGWVLVGSLIERSRFFSFNVLFLFFFFFFLSFPVQGQDGGG